MPTPPRVVRYQGIARQVSDLYFVIASGEDKTSAILRSLPMLTQGCAEAVARRMVAQDDGTYHIFTFSLVSVCSLIESAHGARLVNTFSPRFPLGENYE